MLNPFYQYSINEGNSNIAHAVLNIFHRICLIQICPHSDLRFGNSRERTLLSNTANVLSLSEV